MKTKSALILMILSSIFFSSTNLQAHCQVPCGIYDDSARFTTLKEHITTMAKAMHNISELSSAESLNMNQIVRWTTNKEKHAEEFSEILNYYFLAQRVKPVAEASSDDHKAYMNKLELIHNMIVLAMKCKQTTDMAHIEAITAKLEAFEKAYFN